MHLLTYADLASMSRDEWRRAATPEPRPPADSSHVQDAEPHRNPAVPESAQNAATDVPPLDTVPPGDSGAPGQGVAPCNAMHRDALKLTVAANFRLSRKELGLSQEQFGERIGWTRTRVNKLEHGHNVASPETVEAWAEKTGRDPFWFYVPHADPAEDDDDALIEASV